MRIILKIKYHVLKLIISSRGLIIKVKVKYKRNLKLNIKPWYKSICNKKLGKLELKKLKIRYNSNLTNLISRASRIKKKLKTLFKI